MLNQFVNKMNKKTFSFFHKFDQYVDETKAEETRNIRGYRDNSTKSYVESFLRTETVFVNFLDFTFHSLNSSLLTEVNEILISSGKKPLHDDEHVDFLFKGGNIMNKYFYIFENDVRRTINDGEFDRIKKNFAISDVDYGVHIDNVNYDRYVIICDCVIKILSKKLDEITELYDFLFENRNNGEVKNTKKKTYFLGTNTTEDIHDVRLYENCELFLIELKKYVVNIEFENYENNVNNQNLITRIINEIIDDNLYNLSIYEIILYTNIFQTLQYIFNTKGDVVSLSPENMTININRLKRGLENKIIIKRNKIIDNNQYINDNIIDEYKQKICQYLNEKDDANNYKEIDKFRFEKKNDEIVGVKILNELQLGDIEIKKRKNIIISSQNSIPDIRSIYNSNPEKYHYISFNNTISVKKNNGVTVEFYLLRSKFNTTINGEKILKKKIRKDGVSLPEDESNTDLNIPSEFIDISITGFEDSTGKMMKNENLMGSNYLRFGDTSTNTIIKVYNLEEIAYDLEIVLFAQNYFVPWINQKYDKRIMRLVFFIILNYLIKEDVTRGEAFRKINDIINLIGAIKVNLENNDRNYLNDIDKFININSHPPHLNYVKYMIDNNSYELYIKGEYSLFNYLLKSIITNYVLLTQYTEDKQIFNFINNMRKQYSFSEITRTGTGINSYISEFKRNYKKMIDNLHAEFSRFINLRVRRDTIVMGGEKQKQRNKSGLANNENYFQIKAIKYQEKIENFKEKFETKQITNNRREIIFSPNFSLIEVKLPKYIETRKKPHKNEFIIEDDYIEYDNNFDKYDVYDNILN
jgi:hypothetical protein